MRYTIGKLLRNNIIILVLIIIFIIMSALSSTFFTFDNIINIFAQIAIYGVVAFAMTFAIIAGEFDLSCGSVFALTTILFIDLAPKIGIITSILVCFAVGALIGLLNGWMVAKVRINAFVATMSTMVALKGFALFYTDGKPINYVNDQLYQFGNGSFFGIPYIVIIFFLVFIISELVLRYTKFGRNIYATGGSTTVAQMAGINVKFFKSIIFVIIAMASTFAGIIMACRLNAGNSLFGSDLAMSVVAAVVIGGTSLSGGKGNAIKTFFGMLIIGVLFNALLILGIQANWQNVIKGAILIVVVTVDAYFTTKKA